MRYALDLPNFGDWANPRTLAELAREAEEAGWDGFFLWDHLQAFPAAPFADPWVALAAMAQHTQRIRLGTMVTPLPRRRPWKLARETVSVDQLSGGRLVLGVGIGVDQWREYSAFGEPGDDALHGAMLDEGLEVLTGLWSGEPFSFQGQHYQAQDVCFLPTPAQQPRIPIWVAGFWPHKKPFRRAARWDGVFPLMHDTQMMPADVRAMLAYIRQYRTSAEPFDVVAVGWAYEHGKEAGDALLAEYAEAGVTWWLEGFREQDTTADVRAGIQQGPPRV
ncbi:MAG TPA: LLM class flavin-dependent oxidoreductase [Ktedonobacterales bacterium]|jgi:alkanesulfonate monooxygenase SsuD/methylene tetrahydromethanopterin reductase-like flavin-dependent oxidoreductase (luciferase family)